jgi:hypothetical protein
MVPNTALQIGPNADLGDGNDGLRLIFATLRYRQAFARFADFSSETSK